MLRRFGMADDAAPDLRALAGDRPTRYATRRAR